MPADSDTACTGEIHIIGEIGRIVTEVIGDDYLMDTEISASTSFAHDLELESVEFVSVASRLQGLYGEKVDFVPFITELDMDDFRDLTVGQLAGYIGRCLSAASREPQESGGDG